MEKRWICKPKVAKQRTQKRNRQRYSRWGKGSRGKGKKNRGKKRKTRRRIGLDPLLAQRSGSFMFEFGVIIKRKIKERILLINVSDYNALDIIKMEKKRKNKKDKDQVSKNCVPPLIWLLQRLN